MYMRALAATLVANVSSAELNSARNHNVYFDGLSFIKIFIIQPYLRYVSCIVRQALPQQLLTSNYKLSELTHQIKLHVFQLK